MPRRTGVGGGQEATSRYKSDPTDGDHRDGWILASYLAKYNCKRVEGSYCYWREEGS